MTYNELQAAADKAATICTCGATDNRCTRCRGTGREPNKPRPHAECKACAGLGGAQPHDWGCEGLRVLLIALGYRTPVPPSP